MRGDAVCRSGPGGFAPATCRPTTCSRRRVAREYADYLAGTVYPVDEESDFPCERVLNYAKANGRLEKFEALSAAVEARVKAEGEFLRSHTVLGMLEHINSDSMVAEDVAGYCACIPCADPGEYAGPDLVAVWFQRNIRIYLNIGRPPPAAAANRAIRRGCGHA